MNLEALNPKPQMNPEADPNLPVFKGFRLQAAVSKRLVPSRPVEV